MTAVRDQRGTGVGLAVVSASSFGLSGPFGKALIDAGWSSTGALLARLGGAAAVLLVVLAVTRPGLLAALRRDPLTLLLYGVFAMAGAQGAFFNAVRYLPVPVALLLEYTSPVLVVGWVWLVRRRRPARSTLLGGAVALFGLSLVVRAWSGFGLDWRGVAWGLGSAVCGAVYFLLADRADSTTPPLVLTGVGLLVGSALAALLGATGVLPVATPTSGPVLLAGRDVGWVFTAAFLALVPTVLAYLTGIAAIRRIGASRAVVIGLVEVVSASAASWLLLGEVPTPGQALGGTLILAGAILTRTRSTTGPAVAAHPVTSPPEPRS